MLPVVPCSIGRRHRHHLLLVVFRRHLEMSENVFFDPIPCRSQLFIHIPAPRFSRVLFPFCSQLHWLFPFPPAAMQSCNLLLSHIAPVAVFHAHYETDNQ